MECFGGSFLEEARIAAVHLEQETVIHIFTRKTKHVNGKRLRAIQEEIQQKKSSTVLLL